MLSYLDGFTEYQHVIRGRTKGTLDTYLKAIRQFHAWLKDQGLETNPEAVTASEIKQFMTALIYKHGNISNATRAQKRSALKAFFDYLISEEIQGLNPVDDVPSPKVPKRMPRKFLSLQLALIFKESTPDPSDAWQVRNHAILKVLYASGVRVSELRALDLEHLDDSGRLVRLQIQGKGAKQRVITLKANPAAALRTWLAHRLLMQTEHTAVFIVRRGFSRMSQESLNAVLKKYAGKVGIADADAFAHKMRSTCFADMYDESMTRCPNCRGSVSREDIYSLAAFAGHEDPKTMKEYIDISETVQKHGLSDRRFTELDKLGDKLKRGSND